MDQFNASLQAVYSKAEKFIEPTKELEKTLLSNSKHLYDFMQDVTTNYVQKKNSLKELLINGFDNEQIWQEIELQNNPSIKSFKNNFKQLSLVDNPFKNEIIVKEKRSKKNKKDKVEEEPASENEFSEDFQEDSDDNIKPIEKKYKQTVVDDNFFRLREMEDFLEGQDKIEDLRRDNDIDDDSENEDETNIDLFNSNLSDEEDKAVENIRYKDYFDPPPSRKINKLKETSKISGEENINQQLDEDLRNGSSEEESHLDELEEVEAENIEDDEGENTKTLSNFEKKQTEMKKKIERLEEANISEKPWQLLGETTARKRPVNSLLEEHVTFDHTSVGAPVITQETTETLEDLIKQRIKDEAWDDVERKIKPTTQPYEYKKAPELNQEKSKLSLAEVYEKEYLKEQETEKEDKENKDHVVVQKLMDKLFVKLDALSNFQFTPKPPKPELKIISNVASLQMEEITPITMTEASQLAPEEIFNKPKGEEKGASEKSVTDRKHERREKKIKKKFAVKEKEKKEKLKLKSGKVTKSSKKKAIDQLKKGMRNTVVNEKHSTGKSVKSSNEFFNRLQEEAKSTIAKKKTAGGKENMKKSKKTTNSFKL